MYALIAERVAGNGVDRIDKPLPVRFIPSPRIRIRPRAGIKCSKLIVLVDVALAHTEQPFKNTSQRTGSVRACRAVEIHRLPMRYSIDHAAEVSLPCRYRCQRVPCILLGARVPYIAPKWRFCHVRLVTRTAALSTSQIKIVLNTKFSHEYRPICGSDLPASNQQPVFHGSTVAGPASQIAHIPRFCGVIPCANPAQRIQRFQRPRSIVPGKRREGVWHFVVVRHPARLLPDGLVVAHNCRRRRIICNLRRAVISWIVCYVFEVVPHQLWTLMPFQGFHSAGLDCLNGRYKPGRVNQLRSRAAFRADRVGNRRQVSRVCQIFRHQKLPPFAFAISTAAHAPLTTRRNFPLSAAVTAGTPSGISTVFSALPS